jgi:DNA-binding transcriptional regulator GbsR (MarR family)
MNTEDRIRLQKELVESIGRQAEQEGMQPVTARVMALLMVMDREEYTFNEIVAELNISKSSASLALNTLQIKGIVEYITRPGERKRYFRIKVQEPFYLFEEIKKALTLKRENMQRICDLKANPDTRTVLFFKELQQITDFFLTEMERLKTTYLQNK